MSKLTNNEKKSRNNLQNVNIEKVLKAIKSYKNIRYDKELAELFQINASDLSVRKKRGTLVPLVVDWAIHENININMLLMGKGVHPVPISAPLPENPGMPDKMRDDYRGIINNAVTAYPVAEKMIQVLEEAVREGWSEMTVNRILKNTADTELEKARERLKKNTPNTGL